MTTASVARMVWGSPSVTPTTPTTPTAAVTPTAPTTTPTTNAATTPTTSTGMLGFSTEMPTGYRRQDLGDGSYEVFNANNESMGVGFKSVQDALRERGFANAWRTTSNDNGVWTNPNLTIAQDIWRDISGQEVDVSGMERVDIQSDSGPQVGWMRDGVLNTYTQGTKQVNQQFNSEDEIRAAVNGLLGQRNYNGVMGDWEAIGQVLNGAISPQPQNWGNLPTNQRDEVISGTGMLYGSTPVYGSDGRIIGYRTDLTPNNDAQDFSNGTDTVNQEAFGTFIRHDGRSHDWNNANWRELNDPDSWRRNAIVGEGGNAFIPVENLNNISWTNRDSYQHQDNKEGILSKFWDAEGELLQYIHPDIHYVTRDLIGKETMMQIAEPVGNVIGMYFTGIPIGSLATAADAASVGDSGLMMRRLGNAALAYAAAQMAAPAAGGSTPTPTEAWIDSGGLAGQGSTAGSQLSGSAAGAAAGAGTEAVNQSVLDSITSSARTFMTGDISQITNGAININPTINRMIADVARTAVRSAAQAGATGADLEEAMQSAVAGALAQLVGGTVGAATGSATGSNFVGQVAGQVAGGATGQAVGRELADTSSAPSSGSTSATTTTTQAPQSTTVQPLAGRVARMVWR